jgi:hypothetical protein
VLEHHRARRHEIERIARAPQQSHRPPHIVTIDPLGGGLHFRARKLQPELRDLMDRLEQQFVAMGHRLERFLQRQQLVGPKVALVVGSGRAGENRIVQGHA